MFFSIPWPPMTLCLVMTKKELQARTEKFAHLVLDLLDNLPKSKSNTIISNQLGRAVTSVPANYRAACRSRSVDEFISKIGLVEEEADECHFWLHFLEVRNKDAILELRALVGEANELTAIFTSIGKTLRSKYGIHRKGKN